VFVPDKPLQPNVLQNCSSIDPFVSYEENEMFEYGPRSFKTQTFTVERKKG